MAVVDRPVQTSSELDVHFGTLAVAGTRDADAGETVAASPTAGTRATAQAIATLAASRLRVYLGAFMTHPLHIAKTLPNHDIGRPSWACSLES